MLSQDLLNLEGGKTRVVLKWDPHFVHGGHPRQSQLAPRTHNLFSCFVCLGRKITAGNLSTYNITSQQRYDHEKN